MVSLEFLGSADSVTGSRILVRFHGKTWLIDCGLFQGQKEIRDRNWQIFQPAPSSINGVILTHAHLDHSGYLPKLCREGFSGPIYATEGTTDLCRILLLDAAKLEEEQSNYANYKKYSNHNPAYPLFRVEDAERSLRQFQRQKRHTWISIDKNLSLRFLHAGHIIGASLVQLMFTGESTSKVITFSGDLGHQRSLTIREPELLSETDVLVLESTYGDRLHPREDIFEQLAKIANKTLERGGILLIPAFAVGRSQELIYMIGQLQRANRIPTVPVILDSPMANAATEIYQKHYEDHRERPLSLVSDGAMLPDKFEMTTTVDDSMLVCMGDEPKIIVSASGMLTGGRILHHLKRRIIDPKNTIIFAGYQAAGTKGRFLQDALKDGFSTIRIHHQEYPIQAEIATLEALSSHGDYADLVDWLKRGQSRPETVILNHGEISAQTAFKAELAKSFKFDVHLTCEETKFNFW
jgi:metallo-beta-lactamase family protein